MALPLTNNASSNPMNPLARGAYAVTPGMPAAAAPPMPQNVPPLAPPMQSASPQMPRVAPPRIPDAIPPTKTAPTRPAAVVIAVGKPAVGTRGKGMGMAHPSAKNLGNYLHQPKTKGK